MVQIMPCSLHLYTNSVNPSLYLFVLSLCYNAIYGLTPVLLSPPPFVFFLQDLHQHLSPLLLFSAQYQPGQHFRLSPLCHVNSLSLSPFYKTSVGSYAGTAAMQLHKKLDSG